MNYWLRRKGYPAAGPYPAELFANYIRTGRVFMDEEARADGMNEWVSVRELLGRAEGVPLVAFEAPPHPNTVASLRPPQQPPVMPLGPASAALPNREPDLVEKIIEGCRQPGVRPGQVLTYREGRYATVRLASGEAVMISLAQDGIVIFQMRLGGLIPSARLATWPSNDLDRFLEKFGVGELEGSPFRATVALLASFPDVMTLRRYIMTPL